MRKINENPFCLVLIHHNLNYSSFHKLSMNAKSCITINFNNNLPPKIDLSAIDIQAYSTHVVAGTVFMKHTVYLLKMTLVVQVPWSTTTLWFVQMLRLSLLSRIFKNFCAEFWRKVSFSGCGNLLLTYGDQFFLLVVLFFT